MKSLVYGCAAAALLMGLSLQAHAEIAVDAAPVHAIPADDEDTADAQPLQADAAPKAEPAPVKALVRPKAPPAPVLTAEENAFFAVLGQRVTDAASAYESYVRQAGGIDPAFSSAASVQRAVKASAAYHPLQLEAGIVAYAALIALRDQDFVDGVRSIQNPGFVDDLAAHPEQVMQVRGAQGAAIDVAGVLQAQGAALMASGKAVTKAAYDIQAQAWSRSPVADPKAVLDGAKLSAGQMRAATTPSKEKLLASLVTAPQNAGSQSAAAPDVVRGLALAAMAIMGKTGDGAEARYEALLHDSSSEECLKMAKLDLNQCLAAAGPHYEDVYCAGRHAVSDTGKCIAAAAGAGPADAAPAPRLQTAEVGPEEAAVYGKPVSPAPDADEDEDDDAVGQPAPAPRLLAAAPQAALPPVAAPAPPALAVAPAPAPAPAPRQYAEAELQRIEPQRAEPMPDPRAPRQAPAPQAYAQNDFGQNDYGRQPYAQPSYPQAQYAAPQYPQPQYQQPQYQQPQYQQQPYQQAPYQPPQYQQQPYPQQYAQAQPQAQYAPQYPQPPQYQQPYQPQPYRQPQGYAPQQPYPQPGYPAYQGNGYYGR